MLSEQDAVRKASPETKTASPSTKEHLIHIGLELIRKNGYCGTGLHELLETAGVPRGSFYHHFGSKEEFTAEVIAEYESLNAKHCHEVLGDSRQAPLRRLRRYFEDLILMAGQTAPIQGCLLGGLSLEVASSSPLLRRRLSSSFALWQATIASLLKEAVQQKELPESVVPDSLAGFILNSWEGALLRSQADKSDLPLTDFLHYTFDQILVSRG